MTINELVAKLQQIETLAQVRDEYAYVRCEVYPNGEGVITVFNQYNRPDFVWGFGGQRAEYDSVGEAVDAALAELRPS